MGKWTPGPWSVVIDDTGGPFSGWPSVEAPEHIDAAVVHRAGFKQEFWGDWSKREARANALLISLAPEMAEALRDLVFATECVGINWKTGAPFGHDQLDASADVARAILAKLEAG